MLQRKYEPTENHCRNNRKKTEFYLVHSRLFVVNVPLAADVPVAAVPPTAVLPDAPCVAATDPAAFFSVVVACFPLIDRAETVHSLPRPE
jgi:hypothetical protein